MVDVAAYYRMSTDRQDASIDQQRRECERYAKDRGYRIVAEYIDYGISGDDTAKRREFQRMIRDAQSAVWRVVLCWDQDRFGRFDPIEGGYWIKPLRDAGVRLETVTQGAIDWNDFAGRIVWSVQQEAKHAYLRDLSRNVLRGQIEAAKAGRSNGGRPIGYEAGEDGKLRLGDDREVETVRAIFARYIEGWSLRRVAKSLNADGIQTRRGALWDGSSVRAVLRNPVYCGDMAWNRVSRPGKYHHFDGREIVATAGGKRGDGAIVVRDAHPAIVPRADFVAAQERLKQGKRLTTPVDPSQFLLTGLVRCGQCGSSMCGAKLYGGIPYYQCSGYNVDRGRGKTKRCRCYSVRESQLIEAVAGAIREELKSDAATEELTALAAARGVSTAEDVDDLQKRLAAVERKLDKAERRLIEVSRDVLSIVENQIRELRSERDSIAERIGRAERIAGRVDGELRETIDKALANLDRLVEVVKHGDRTLVKRMFREMVERIDVRFVTAKWGKSVRHHFAGGTISLAIRPQDLCNATGRTEQVYVVPFRVA